MLALFLYRSFESRPVLGLWSHAYTGVLAGGVGLLVVCLALAVRSARRGVRPALPERLLDFAILFWGVSYLASALDDRDAAARILDLNFVGSVMPLPALGEWLAITLAGSALVGWLAGRLGDTGRKLLLGAATLGILALLGEGALRVRAAVAPQTQGFPTYTSQQWSRRYVALNGEGFRDVEHPKATPAGEHRLLVVGDSYAFGSGVNSVEDRLGEQLARRLTERLGEPWHSMSAALGDSDTLEEIAFLERMQAYERDAVLLVYVFNDVDYLAAVTPRTVLTEHQGGIAGRIHPARILFLNSYLFQEVFVRGRLVGYALSDELTPSERAYADDETLERHLDDLTRFVALAGAKGTPVWIAPFDTAAADGGRFAARYQRFMERARARGLPVLSLAGAFAGHAPASLTVNRLDGHPNAQANGLAAKTLLPPLARSLAQ